MIIINEHILHNIIQESVKKILKENRKLQKILKQAEIDKKTNEIQHIIKSLIENNKVQSLNDIVNRYMILKNPETNELTKVNQNISDYIPRKYQLLHKIGKEDAAEEMYNSLIHILKGNQRVQLWQSEKDEKRIAKNWISNTMNGQSFRYPNNKDRKPNN